jgi:hypothetical protein
VSSLSTGWSSRPQLVVTGGHHGAMRPTLEALSRGQGGIFTRRQALVSGYTKREFDRLSSVRSGQWFRVRYGVYVTREMWEGLDDRERSMLTDRAALLVCDADTVLSHTSAARRHGFDLHGITDDYVHVTRRRTHGRKVNRLESGVKHHCGVLEEIEIEIMCGVPVTSALRTVADITIAYGYLAGLVVADCALRAGASKPELIKLCERLSSSPSAPTLRAVATDADGRSESVLETLARVLLRRINIGDVEPQFVIEIPGGPDPRVDLIAHGLRHVFECDGKTKYRDQTDDRGRPLTAREIVWQEKLREDAIRGQGFGVSRITWPDVVTPNVDRVGARIWREIRQQNASGLYLPTPA